jgi:hypothetical protein
MPLTRQFGFLQARIHTKPFKGGGFYIVMDRNGTFGCFIGINSIKQVLAVFRYWILIPKGFQG